MKKVKLNLGSGDIPIDGYRNFDRKTGQEAYPLDVEDNSIDEIRASHILEHFDQAEAPRVIECWASKLKPGGLLKIAVPDFAKIMESYKAGGNHTVGYCCGGQIDANDYHKNLFDRQSLTGLLERAGLCDIKHWESEVQDCAGLPVSLNLQGRKSNHSPELQNILRDFESRKKNRYSQYGEDGITEAIFEKVGVKNRWCLEVGASDGILFSNSRQFVEEGWNVILIESEKLAYDRLVENCRAYPNTIPIFGKVGLEFTLDEVLEKYGVPRDLDLMIIDIDGQDYHVWNAMMRHNPRVIVVEFDPAADSEHIPPLGAGEDGKLDQAGRTAMVRLGSSKGYRACIDTDVNLIMLHESLFARAEPEKETKTESPVTCKSISPAPIAGDGETQRVTTKITAIMSAPRLGFTNNLMLHTKVLVPLGIEVEIGFGVFWGQILTRMMQEQLEKGVEWIVVMDYDSYYTREHFLALMQLMAEYPEVDALMPIQMKREEDTVLAGVEDSSKANHEYAADTDLIQVDTGHFGLTFFRLASFAKLKKPWFLPVPNADGEWGEGRLDEDIYFWKNFRESGLKLCLTPQVLIGHIQLMVTWPGTLEKGSRPFHQYLNDCAANGIPQWCRVAEDRVPKLIK